MDRNSYVTRTRAPTMPTKNYSKLLSLTLKRIFYQRMAGTLKSLHNHSTQYSRKINRIEKIAMVNNELCLTVGWRKIKAYALLNKSEERLFKSAFILARRIQMQWVREAFCNIKNHALVAGSSSFKKIDNLKKLFICQTLRKLFYNSKKNVFTRIKQRTILHKLKKRVMVIHTIFRSAQKRSLLYGWAKLLNLCIRNKNKQKDGQLEDLQVQLQDMRMQVENKNQNINRLQDQLFDLRQNSVAKNSQNSSFMFNNSFGNRSASQLHRSRSKYGESNEGSIVRDASYGSLLGVSALTYKSRGSNHNTSNRQDNCACSSCGYREKYQKYKAANQTLKKQLEIIKTELQFTKDMNQHMQNQIKSLFTNEDKEKKLQKLRIDLKQCQKDRELLRDKVSKYQKYIAKLKAEFKVRIEEIYRRVKKNNA